ncbi:transcriptional adapter 2-alpha [[Emmonsia] crescens]|uniref:Transcriptional adapter 2-alpha n=1 Tax=[Emmonsia] crescens TaxID=73230 RepID=A0A0G2JB08_9EURO|nr:transcriptional adapter 2-alpha [Emmonsia crescens UAMH 3008]
MTLSTFTKPPPPTQHCLLSFPTPEILLVTLNRPKSLNCVNSQGHAELHAVWEWMDAEPLLRVGIITGKGRAFCAGADLKEWNDKNAAHSSGRPASPASGFAGLSRRAGKKPVICAVNGLAYGGGCEIIINADIVIASKRAAKFALPEVKRGVEAERWGLVNEVVEDGGETDEMDVGERRVVKRAVEVAGDIVANSPDAVIVSREGIKLGWEGVGAEDGSRLLMEGWANRLNQGENLKEGVKAFVEKRSPRWVASKL